MIWLRRVFTLPLILIFFVLLVAAVTVTAVNNTAANPDFYNDQMVRADVYNYVYDSVFPTALDRMDTADMSDLPVDVDDLHNEIVATVEQAFPAPWLQQQFEAATNVLIPYMVDNEAWFIYTLAVKDRIYDVGQAIKDNIFAGSAFLIVYDDVISYMAEYYYQQLPSSPYGAGITKNDIEMALRELITHDWLREQLSEAVDEVIPYLAGDRNYFEVNIPVQELMTDQALTQLLGPGSEDYLDEAWDWIGVGWTYTQNDLYADLSAEGVQNLQDVRGWIHDGYTVDQDDLREAISDNPEELQDFDDARHWVSVGRSLIWVLWLVPFLLLVGIGFLGGRGWKTRAAGPLVILFIVALVMFLGVMLTWGQWGEVEMRSAIDTSGHQGVEAVMLEKAEVVAIDSADSFVGEMQNTYMYMMIASGVGLAAVGVWWLISSRSRKGTV